MSHACSPLSAGRDSLAVGLPKFESERLFDSGAHVDQAVDAGANS